MSGFKPYSELGFKMGHSRGIGESLLDLIAIHEALLNQSLGCLAVSLDCHKFVSGSRATE